MLTPADFRRSLLALEDFLRGEELSNAETEVLLEHLVVLNQAKRELADIYDIFSAEIVRRMEKDNLLEVELPNASVQKKTSYSRKSWDHKSLMEATYDRISRSSIDMDTGEVLLSSKEIALRMLEFFNPSYWRVKELSKIGINADQYCEVGEEKTNIAIYTKGADK